LHRNTTAIAGEYPKLIIGMMASITRTTTSPTTYRRRACRRALWWWVRPAAYSRTGTAHPGCRWVRWRIAGSFPAWLSGGYRRIHAVRGPTNHFLLLRLFRLTVVARWWPCRGKEESPAGNHRAAHEKVFHAFSGVFTNCAHHRGNNSWRKQTLCAGNEGGIGSWVVGPWRTVTVASPSAITFPQIPQTSSLIDCAGVP
jgi:hypothetical protein